MDRQGIAEVITILNESKPKTLAVDIIFSNRTVYEKDWKLFNALDDSPNLVMASKIHFFEGFNKDYKRFVDETEPEFLTSAVTGFTNVILENDSIKTLKKFCVQATVNGKIEYHFSVQIAMLYDSVKAKKFILSNPSVLNVDYKSGKSVLAP